MQKGRSKPLFVLPLKGTHILLNDNNKGMCMFCFKNAFKKIEIGFDRKFTFRIGRLIMIDYFKYNEEKISNIWYQIFQIIVNPKKVFSL